MIRRVLGIGLFIAVCASPSHATPEITTPATLNLGNTLVQTQVDQVLTIQNTGNQTLMVNSIEVSGSATFSLPTPPVLPVALGNNKSMQVTVRFAPTLRGAQSGNVAIGSNDPVTPTKNVALAGTGVAPAIQTSPHSPLDFGNVGVPSTADRTLTIINNGDSGVSLVVNSMTISGDASFSIESAPTLTTVMAPFGFLNTTIRFAPTSVGVATCTIQIESSDPFTPTKVVDVTGTALGPVITTDPSSIDFGNLPVFALGEIVYSIKNDAVVESDLAITDVAIIGPDSSSFHFGEGLPTFPIILPRPARVQLPIYFSPVTQGSKVAAIIIQSNDPVTPTKTINLTGFATPSFVGVSPDAKLEFALLGPMPNPASSSARFDFTLPEAGAATLSIFDVHGRHVATVANGAHSAGPQSVRWDASDDAGRRVPGGVYFARLVAAHKAITTRFAVVR